MDLFSQPFYNTIKESGVDLAKSNTQASKQEERIIDLMNIPCTPFEMHEKYCQLYPEVPITSIRRAMTNLSNKGILEKTEDKKTEKYGKANYVWKRTNQNI